MTVEHRGMRYYSCKCRILVINDSGRGHTPAGFKQDAQAALSWVFPLPNRITGGCGAFCAIGEVRLTPESGDN